MLIDLSWPCNAPSQYLPIEGEGVDLSIISNRFVEERMKIEVSQLQPIMLVRERVSLPFKWRAGGGGVDINSSLLDFTGAIVSIKNEFSVAVVLMLSITACCEQELRLQNSSWSGQP